MESSRNTEAAISLFDTTGQSTFALAEKENQIVRLKRQVRVLESENAEFASSQPRLRNALGKDCTAEMVKLDKELLLAKEQCERWRNDFDEMSKKYEKFEKATIEQIDKRDKQIEQFRDQAMEMEEENGKLREMLQDEKSRVWRMHQEEFGSQVATPKAQIFADVLSADPAQNVGVPGNDEMVGDFDVNDADQIATNLLMILETLDKKQHDSTKLQNNIFAFLTANGINSNNPEKFAAFSSVYKKVIDKRLAEIRTGNEQLRSNLSLGDKDLEACMKHLTVQDSQVATNLLILESMDQYKETLRERFSSFTYRELQKEAKANSIPARQKKVELIEALVQQLSLNYNSGENSAASSPDPHNLNDATIAGDPVEAEGAAQNSENISTDTVEEAISVLKQPTDQHQQQDLHPEKRVRAAFTAFEERRLAELKEERPTLRLSQLKQLVKKEWLKSVENPLNQHILGIVQQQ
ncbi:hypothetical protein GPALN_011355 [Globodera pallida]|nr:hypothetical protein GPALN_011355 [Globodera pallida]